MQERGLSADNICPRCNLAP